MKTPMARADKRNLPATGIDGDRLSSLPGEILSHILSFLETKYAVSTSILSRRWKYLWTRVSILDLVDSLHVPSQEPRDLAFSRFVDRVLSEHMNLNSVRRLRLLFSTNSRPSSSFWCKMELDSHASQLEEIDVRPPRHSGMRGLPQSFYALKNLMVLKLDFVMLTPGDGYVFLPSLKVLQLFSVEITDCESLARLFSGCPVLEILRMKYCYSSISDKNENYVITASLPSLKNLAIIGTGGHDPNLCRIVVDAPSLEHLHLKDFEEFGFWGSSRLPCLVSARIDIRWTHEEHPLIGFLTHISNAKELWLSWRILSHLAVLVQDVQLPVFPKLTHLTLEGGGSSCVLHPFLNSASQLQSLVICFGKSLVRTKWEESEPARTPECLLSSLEEIEINDLAAGEDEIKMVAYLLKAGAVLNKVNLRVVDVDLDIKDRKVLASLLKLPRGSSACEVHLFYSNNEIPDEDFFTMMPFIC